MINNIKKFVRTTISISLTLCILITIESCDESQTDSSSNKITISENYLFYSNNGGVFAVDSQSPTNPIEVEAEGSSVSGAELIRDVFPVGSSNNSKSAYYPYLVYAKQGYLWRVNALKLSALAPELFSRESKAFNICYASDTLASNATSDNYMIYEYSISSDSADCVLSSSLNEKKYIEVSGPVSQSPKFRNESPEYSFNRSAVKVFVDSTGEFPNVSYTITGQLVRESTGAGTMNLVWYDSELNIASRLVVTSNISGAYYLRQGLEHTYFLVIDGQIRLFDNTTKELGEPLHTYPVNNTYYPDLDPEYSSSREISIFDTSGIYRLPRDGSSSARKIYARPDNVIAMEGSGATEDYLIVIIHTEQDESVIAIPFNDTGVKILAHINVTNTHYSYIGTLSGNRVVIGASGDARFISFVSADGRSNYTIPNAVPIKFYFVQQLLQKPPGFPYLLAGVVNNDLASLTIISLDETGRKLVNLGTIPFSGSVQMLQTRDHFNDDGSGLIAIKNTEINSKIFYANIFQDNSLTFIADTESVESIID